MIRAALDEAGVTPDDLSALGVGLGPGPFTGLRVGIVTAKAMSDALGIPAYGECSLDLVADQHGAIGGSFAALSDARRKQVYWAVYDAAGVRLDGPDLGRPDDVAEQLRGRAVAVAARARSSTAKRSPASRSPSAGQYPSAAHLGWRVRESALARTPRATDLRRCICAALTRSRLGGRSR